MKYQHVMSTWLLSTQHVMSTWSLSTQHDVTLKKGPFLTPPYFWPPPKGYPHVFKGLKRPFDPPQRGVPPPKTLQNLETSLSTPPLFAQNTSWTSKTDPAETPVKGGSMGALPRKTPLKTRKTTPQKGGGGQNP